MRVERQRLIEDRFEISELQPGAERERVLVVVDEVRLADLARHRRRLVAVTRAHIHRDPLIVARAHLTPSRGMTMS